MQAETPVILVRLCFSSPCITPVSLALYVRCKCLIETRDHGHACMLCASFLKRSIIPARQSGSPEQQCWSNFCIFVDSIDSQIILRMIRESKKKLKIITFNEVTASPVPLLTFCKFHSGMIHLNYRLLLLFMNV